MDRWYPKPGLEEKCLNIFIRCYHGAGTRWPSESWQEWDMSMSQQEGNNEGTEFIFHTNNEANLSPFSGEEAGGLSWKWI